MITIMAKSSRRRLILFLLILAVFTISFLLICLNRYWQYQYCYYDFGIFDSAIRKVAHFQAPIIDKGFNGQIIFSDHFNPSIFLVSPLYWFTDKAEVIIISQIIFVSISALIAYSIADKKLKNKLEVFALIIAYLWYIGLQNALIFDIHDTTFSVLPLIVIFWSIFNQKWKVFFLSVLIFLGYKESNAGAIIGIAIYLALKYRKLYFKQAIATFFIGIIWGFITTKYIIPYFNHGLYVYTPHGLSLNPLDFVHNFFLPAEKIKTIFASLATFGFLPLFDLALLPAIFEQFSERFVLSNAPNMWGLIYHYNATLSPLMFIAAVDVLEFLERRKVAKLFLSGLSIAIILIVFIFQRFIYHGPFGLVYNPVFYEQTPRTKYQDNFVAHFPKGGLMMTQNDLAVRATHINDSVRLLRVLYYSVNPDYIALNLTPGQSPNSFYPLSFEQAKELKNTLIKNPDYSLQKFAPEQYLFTKKKLEIAP